ncbi:hypothetical protein ACFWU5_16485 [Nocardia sp. NPDC058640]|uniref:hypothetical protein n=1 Tax=Nocardia sp. NPDC058640 TaxID=3346571 RepID=UPI003659684A
MTTESRTTAAICAQPEHETWARKHRASMWDYHIEGETKQDSISRRRRAVGLCATCPVRAACNRKHKALGDGTDGGAHVPGIWGGRVFADKTSHYHHLGRSLFDQEEAA